MTKDELASSIASKTGVEKQQVVKTVEALMETIRVSMAKNETIYLRGFGTFLNKRRKAKPGRNITKNTTVLIPEHVVPSFKPAKEFVEKIKTKKV
jgi:DNA-binding protein HU-beta